MSSPIGYTCPDINAAIKIVKAALSSLNHAAEELYDMEATLESLRDDNSKLREYGEKMEKRVSELEMDLDTLETITNVKIITHNVKATGNR